MRPPRANVLRVHETDDVLPRGCGDATVAVKVGAAHGTITEYTIPTAGSNPESITSGPDGALWFGEDHANAVGRVTTSGTFTAYTASDVSVFITTGPDGAVWFTEYSASKIGRLVP